MPRQVDQFIGTSDEALVDYILDGDQLAKEALVRRHGGWMLSVAQRYMRDQALAEDCIQEAFAKALAGMAGFERRSSLKSWLHRIVVNQALMKLRMQRARNEKNIDDLMPEFDADACRIEQPWPQILTPEQIVGVERLRAAVLSKIDELPDIYRHVVLLRDIEEMTTSEVADALGMTEANVKVRLHRGRSALKYLLEPILRGEVT